jgi:hypothetical protein
VSPKSTSPEDGVVEAEGAAVSAPAGIASDEDDHGSERPKLLPGVSGGRFEKTSGIRWI